MGVIETSGTSPFLGYDTETGAHRSAAEEWQPHRTHTDKSVEWWYSTSVVHDASGTPYFLFWCIFRYTGSRYVERLSPAVSALITPGKAAYVCLFTLTNYRTNARTESPMVFVMPDDEVWDAKTSTLRLHDAQRRHWCTWSFDGGRLNLQVRSRGLACELRMRGGSQVMWAKDKLGKEGLIQEGPEGDYSFYYSLPRLEITGSIRYMEDGRSITSQVGGFGWVDRQWGDFLTSAWEWASFRFNNGARVNLYNFYNGHQVATYQKTDGSSQWFDTFIVKQNGYARTMLGTWVSHGWSYEFPIDVEGSRLYRLEPFSKLDMVKGPGGKVFYEGPSHLVDETSGKTVGISVNESMDVRLMGNAPYGPRQR